MSAAGAGCVAAFAGGLVSFASPCVLTLVPAYLSVITGLEISEIEHGRRHHLWRIARDTGLFVAGFAVVFILLGLTAMALGQALVHRQALIIRISGLLGAGVRVVHRRVAGAEVAVAIPGTPVPPELARRRSPGAHRPSQAVPQR